VINSQLRNIRESANLKLLIKMLKFSPSFFECLPFFQHVKYLHQSYDDLCNGLVINDLLELKIFEPYFISH